MSNLILILILASIVSGFIARKGLSELVEIILAFLFVIVDSFFSLFFPKKNTRKNGRR